MTTTFKRTVARGFTLIELLIVVIIVAILAAIVIPQFSSSTSDAQLAALDANLANVRTAIEQYKAQHGNVYPGAKTSTSANCTNGATIAGAADSADAVIAQLTGYSNAAGEVCNAPNDNYKFGPYMRQIPVEPINTKNDLAVTNTGVLIVPANTAAGGWAFDTKSGQFVMNSAKTDSNDKAYYKH